jgi:hypothetical protein
MIFALRRAVASAAAGSLATSANSDVATAGLIMKKTAPSIHVA